MRGPHNLIRLIRTGATFEKTGAMAEILDAMEAGPGLRVIARLIGWPFKWLGYRGDPDQEPVVRALTALGPAYIKFGQILSTRPDIVGPKLATQMRVLQDKLPPFPIEDARAEVERVFERPVDELFSSFSEPVAAASIAQVHRATTRDTGRDVAVKILRPGIERAFMRDVDAFYFAAWMVETFAPGAKRLRPREVIAHFEGVVLGELDLRLEAAASSEFAANTQRDADFRLPAVVWPLSDRRVFTSEWADGINMGDMEAVAASGQDLKLLAMRIIQTFLNHALRDGYFHADMHQGNLKLASDGAIVAIDFGIMGRIDAYTRRVYAEILIGFLRRDYRRVAEVHFEAGYVPRDRDVEAFAQTLRSIGEPIFGQAASEISMARLLAHLFDVTEQFGMETRTELILLQRTMVVVEGVARSLDPAINMWEAARPVVEHYIRTNVGPVATAKDLAATARVLARFGPRLPDLAERALTRAAEDARPPERSGLPGWLWAGIGAAGALLTMAVLG